MSSIGTKQKHHPVQPVPGPMMHGILHCGFSVTRIAWSQGCVSLVQLSHWYCEWCLWNDKSIRAWSVDILPTFCAHEPRDRVWFRYVMIIIIFRISWQDLTRWLNDGDTNHHSVGFWDSIFFYFLWCKLFSMTLKEWTTVLGENLVVGESAKVRILEVAWFQAKGQAATRCFPKNRGSP